MHQKKIKTLLKYISMHYLPFIIWSMISFSIMGALAYCVISKLKSLFPDRHPELNIHEDEVSFNQSKPYHYIQYTERILSLWPMNFHKFGNI